MRQNSEAKIVTFPGHEFSVRLVNHIPGTDVNFTVGGHDETLIVYKDSVSGALYFQRKDAMTEFEDYLFEVINSCKDQHAFSSQPEERLNCVKHGIFDEMMRVKTSTKLTTSFRNDMANRLTDYMCNDETLESTTPVNRYDFYHNNQSYSVNVYLDTHTAKIWAVDDIISTEECAILAREGFPTLETAATTDEQGENIMTDERVAEQGRYLFEEAKEGADELW
jgi:WD40 repeat protein